jgi:mannose-6-phosphate isomerase-like protein (cupin superfamily)
MEIKRKLKPWGNFEQFTHNEISTVKILNISSSELLSMQSHKQRDEYWKILSGQGVIRIGPKTFQVEAGDEYFIPRNIKHRAMGITDLKILEISFGEFSDTDIVRYEDTYGRVDERP